MSEMRFSEDHEWIRVEDGIGTCGISEYAQEQLGDVVFVDLPEVGRKVTKGEEIAVVESVKAASEIYAPVSGEIVSVNDALEGEPGQVNSAAEGDGWFFKVRLADADELAGLMDDTAYKAFVEGL